MKKILFSMAVMLAIVSSCNKSKTEQSQASEPVAQDTVSMSIRIQAKQGLKSSFPLLT